MQLQDVWKDLTYAMRGIRRNPWFTIVVVGTLALGIGANAALFSIVDRLLLRVPADVRDPHDVSRVYVTETFPGSGPSTRGRMTYAEYASLRDNTHSFAAVTAYFPPTEAILTYGSGTEIQHVNVEAGAASFFPLLGVRPVLGRFFSSDEDLPPAGVPVAVLSYRLWQRGFGGDTGVLGTRITLGKTSYTVVGVGPKGFSGIDLEAADVWIPLSNAAFADFGSDWYRGHLAFSYRVLVRLRQAISKTPASTEATLAIRRARLERQAIDPNARVFLGSIIAGRGPEKGPYNVALTERLVGVAAIVLLIACANIANLLLGRALRRRREIGIRLAVGVSRSRLVVQLLIESLLLALMSGGAALLLAFWGSAILRALLLPSITWTKPLVDLRTAAFTVCIALLAGILTGLIPALRASHLDFTVALKEGWHARSGRPTAIRSFLLIIQAALSVVLLVGAGLFIRSLTRATSLDIGLDAGRLLVVRANFRGSGSAPNDQAALYEQMAERVRALPVVERAAVAAAAPFWSTLNYKITVPDRDSLPVGNHPYFNVVGPDFFATLGTQVLAGRAFLPADRSGSPPVAILNETMARLVWPGESAIGKCIQIGSRDRPCARIVGIVQDIHQRKLIEDPAAEVFVPLKQSPPHMEALRALVVRSTGDPASLVGPIRAAVRNVVPAAIETRIIPLQQLIDPELRPWRLGVKLFSAFGVLALLVTAVGLYSVISYSVTQRTHELGIRLALGARPGELGLLIMRQTLRIMLFGVVLGSIAALAAGRLISSLLYATAASDPAVFGIVAITLLVVAVMAVLLPTRRAMRVDPLIALRIQ